MFLKLRNKLILTNLGITGLVVLVVFTGIYVMSTGAAEKRPPRPLDNISFEQENANFEQAISATLREEKQAAAENLLITLVAAGVAIEVAVAVVSYFMAEQAIRPVREAYTAQKLFIANASHEIKTPLTAIQANLEAADLGRNKWIRNAELETAKLAALNSELLTLARTDLVATRPTEEVDLKAVIHENLESLTPRMKNLMFTQKIVLAKKIKINRGDFVQLLNILLDNAIKYADSKIILQVSERTLTIQNDGAKIPEEALPHLFDRFYQVDKTAEGVGLGLSIAKALADRNGWKLTAKSENLTSFILQF